MKPCGMKDLADEIIVGMREALPAALGTDSEWIWPVCVCGSYVRGDFIEGNSDLDFSIILQPGMRDRGFRVWEIDSTPGGKAIRELVGSLLKGRTLCSHNPHGFDWVVVPWESLPKSRSEIHLPNGAPHLPLFSIFLFDYIENLEVLWGTDPRTILTDPLPFSVLAEAWFDSIPVSRQRHRDEGNECRIPFSAFKSIQIAQVLFGEQTLDKRRLLELYQTHVPDFRLKQFGCQVIRDKMEQKYPDKPCQFAPYDDYAAFEDELSQVVKQWLEGRSNKLEQAHSAD